ncbi:eukaryotic translation initiation factor 4E-binding protein Mextli isoform X2 [Toxorhynchites rutilus septentrionalis]|uniref:eukaryotic translation initiation factor 4E-binding protein Mextli isoform X2 n=1 Tax=Toxorhynchites rutilus septentrionalis TaxID=329112 RepID=UPI00247B1EB8|nr:eukaryotic translation initiation factor 4E-binding protein Mextli isoform X2 [Toxorhynchites rutilus septentrionalis]
MSQMGRAVKNLEPPRPLKSTMKQSHVHVPVYEVQSIEELISLTENVATNLANGCNNADGMNALLANLRLHGPQLENVSKDTLDKAFVIFRNASQDERLNIMTRLNLLELIELRAKSWQVSDGINTYYKHKATNVEPDLMGDPSLLSTSPPGLSLGQQVIPSLSPGELIRTSGKFPKPTKIPGKTYCKDEIVIRNADSGKVNPGAKERLVQITGPNEEKINYAKQLIEDTIRRNASPVRLETSQDGSCSSLASSASDEMIPRRQISDGSNITMSGNAGQRNSMLSNQSAFVPNQQISGPQSAAGLNLNLANNTMYQQHQQQQQQYPSHPKLVRNGSQNNGQQSGMLLHSFSTNDASLGEYKYTVNIGRHSIKITGDCFELVRVAKLVLDDYFSSNEFLASVEMGSSFDLPTSLASPVTPMAGQHPLITGSPFVDSGVGLDAMAAGMGTMNLNCTEVDDDVFIVDPPTLTGGLKSGDSSSSSNSTLVTSTPVNNGLSRSRRSHFSRKDSAPEGIKDGAGATPATKDDSTPVRIVHEYERLIYYSKSPHSWALPRDWSKICEKLPFIVRNKVNDTFGSEGTDDITGNRDRPTGTQCISCDDSPSSNLITTAILPLTTTNTNTNKNGCGNHDTNNNNINSTSDKNGNFNAHRERRAQYLAKGFLNRHGALSTSSFDMAISAGTGRIQHHFHKGNTQSFHRYKLIHSSGGSIESAIPYRLIRYKSTDD